MKRVMIVDDEVLVRVGIKALLNWEEHDYTIVADASDGEEALAKMEKCKPDIVLTDLKMEPMDGFLFMQECIRRNKVIKFIVLSNYNDFENVRKAMKMGAFDYVFKLTVKPLELLNIMNDACSGMEIADHSTAADHQQVIHKNFDVIKTNLLYKILGGGNLENVVREMKDIPLNIELNKVYRMVHIKIDNLAIARKKGDFQDLALLNFTMENITSELFNRICKCEVICYKERDLLLICNYEVNSEEFIKLLEKEFAILVQCVKKYLGLDVSGALSKEYRGVEYIKKAIAENTASMERRFFYETNQLYLAKESMEEKSKAIADDQWEEIKEIEKIEEMIVKGIYQESRILLEKILDRLEEGKDSNPQEIKYYMRKIYKKIYSGFIKRSVDIEMIQNEDGVNLEEALNGYDFFNQIKEKMLEFMELYRRESEASTRVGIRKPCRKEIVYAQGYINSNLGEGVSLSTISAMVNMSESRFSHVFKEEIGVSFIEYVNQIKLDEACKLLKNTDMKMNEIGEKVGIFNPNYFSAQFKKKTGLSPNEFRKLEWGSGK